MPHLALITLAATLAAATAPPAKGADVLSTGKEVALAQSLVPEKPTLFLFLKPSSTMERAFAEDLQREVGGRAGVRLIQLQTGAEPVARQYEVTETPTAVVYDRRGRLVARSSDAEAIRAAVRKAAGVMRIDWAEEGDPRLAEAQRLLGRPVGPGILRTMSLKPEYLAGMQAVAQKAHFQDGFLPRRIKEMIATRVSALNKCRY
ncbi:MAG TPA: carboxymuconolactone decarboxylase family protein [Armatimonadota bacterium]|nr:carboxymuconolactone decarboxylase family protein [Armatimonadota bacterium]